MNINTNYFENQAQAVGADITSDVDDIFSEIQRLREEKIHIQGHLDRIFGITSAIIYILDANGRFTFVNRGAEEILKFPTEELIGKHFSFILPPDEYERVSREAVLPKIAGRILGPEASPKFFDERRRRGRRTRNLEVKLMSRCPSDYRLISGEVMGVVEVEGAYAVSDSPCRKEIFLGSQGVIFDITKYKKSELERLELQKRLFHIQKMDALGKLSGRVAHDLNNKLGSIIGTAEIIKQGLHSTPPEKLAIYLDNILAASKHAAELSGRLSKFSRRGESPFEQLNFHCLLNGVMGFVSTIADDSVNINKVLLSKSPLIVGSETILQNAILNLVMNALDAMKNSDGTLTIETIDVMIEAPLKTVFHTTVQPGDYLLVSVRDTGAGMDDETKKRLFEPFFTTDAEKGYGLGLVSIRECIGNHGGTINLESNPGRGSRFDVYLPKANE